MDPACSSRDCSGIEDDVPHLSEEHIGAGKLEKAPPIVLVRIDEAQASVGEIGRCLDGWHVIGIADDLCVVVVNDRAGDLVCTGGEVDNCWCESRTRAGRVTATAITGANGGIDRGCVVGDLQEH